MSHAMGEASQSSDGDSDGTLRDILADLVSSQAESSQRSVSLPSPPQADSSWILPPYSPLPTHATTSPSRLPPAPMPRTSSVSRPALQQIAASAGNVPQSSGSGDTTPQTTMFNTPTRSIFSSGPPTASLSASTAQASISSAASSGTSRPLAALSATSSASNRRNNTTRSSELPPLPVPMHIRRRNMQISQKDVDDPTTSLNVGDSSQNTTSAALSKLFAASDGTPHSLSRGVSHQRTMSGSKNYSDTSTLSGHLLQRGMMDGRYSDITIHAFGSSYKLHRLLLDRVPFFSSALSGPWTESSASEIDLHPEDIDSNITKAAFELALKRVYGCYLPADEELEAVGLFATSSWLDMSNVVDSSVDILLRQMQPSRLDSLIRLVTNNYYGKAGDRILASAKAMLCRDGWEMPYKYWDNIPSEIVREVVGGDAFFVPGEWERWYLALRLLNRRLRAKAVEAGLVSGNGRYLHSKPTGLNFFAVRFDATYRRDSMVAGGRGSADKDEKWIGVYTSPDIAPLLVLLDEGIHYVHLRFEQLQCIRQQRDLFGVPVLPEKVISDALWMQMELRQRVVTAPESDMELGLSREADSLDEDSQASEIDSSTRKGKRPESHAQQDLDMESGSWDGNGQPRKFWIPNSDSSSVMGGTSDAMIPAVSPNTSGWSPHMSRLSASLEPADVQWATDFTANGAEGPPSGNPMDRSSNPRYSHYPPFRFSAEFPNPRELKEKKRVYSQTVWYAGSMWNLYIQRVTSKTQQLGIYLHRAKDKEPTDDHMGIPGYGATVDDRIGQLERDMILRRGHDRRHQSWRSSSNTIGHDGDLDEDGPGPAETLEPSFNTDLGRAQKTSQNPDIIMAAASPPPNSHHSLRTSSSHILDSDSDDEGLYGASTSTRLSLHFNHSHSHPSPNPNPTPSPNPATSISTSNPNNNPNTSKSPGLRKNHISALPPYTDARPAIKTYFKIYSPSRAGRMLSVYESAPDKFNFSQSWGWKSSQMVLDDGIVGAGGGLGMGGGMGGGLGGGDLLGGGLGGNVGTVFAAGLGAVGKSGREGRLRYMVVIGNV